MKILKEEHNIQFFTATILKWKHLLSQYDHMDVVLNSLRFLVEKERVKVLGFVIMPNHIHLLWQIRKQYLPEDIQRDFLKFTAQQFKFRLKDNNDPLLNEFKVKKSDRKFQFWQEQALSKNILSPEVFEQKLDYIHDNPMQAHWCLVEKQEEYYYSSAAFYMEKPSFDFITDYREVI